MMSFDISSKLNLGRAALPKAIRRVSFFSARAASP